MEPSRGVTEDSSLLLRESDYGVDTTYTQVLRPPLVIVNDVRAHSVVGTCKYDSKTVGQVVFTVGLRWVS